MKRFTVVISIFFIALAFPLGYFILLAYQGIIQAEQKEFQYFVTLLFDEMEEELMTLIRREEQRALDEYSYYLAATSPARDIIRSRSPLSGLPKEPYILGYFQNNPDDSFQTPLLAPGQPVPDERIATIERLRTINDSIKRLVLPKDPEEEAITSVDKQSSTSRAEPLRSAEKYLDMAILREHREQHIRDEQTPQSITQAQVLNITQREPLALSDAGIQPFEAVEPDSLQVEVGAMQSLVINDQEILIFRRVIINQQVYRQGFVLLVREFLKHLRDAYFPGQPMAEFANLRLEIRDQERRMAITQAGLFVKTPRVTFQRTFPAPFSFLQATISCKHLPGSTSRRNLNLMRILIGIIILSGLLAIYHGTRVIVEMSERRAQFASSVTHELKTPLTNIQMYAEMLEQGIAPNRDREQEYFHILRSESKRLSRLIDNVLEFSKLSKHQRYFHLQEGKFDEVIQEVQDIIQPTIRRQGFSFTVEKDMIPPFRYDREVMVQILLNLIDNSIKFGKMSPVRSITLRVQAHENQIRISVSDTGPGIPCVELKKVFDDFYRIDNELGRATRGTGLGLSLVRQFITALGGTVRAANNDGPGCTITLTLPMPSG